MKTRVRPTFLLEVCQPEEEILRNVGRRLRSTGCPVSGLAAPGRIELHVHGKDEHLWSPQLIVDIEPTQDGAVLRCRFGPHPSVWTLYTAAYAALVFLSLVIVSFAYAQWAMGAPPWALLALPALLLIAAGLYVVALLGQDVGAPQMDELRTFLEDAIASHVA